MATEENRRLVLEFMETVFNQQDIGKAAQFLAPDFVEHNPHDQDGLEAFQRNIPVLLAHTPKGSLVVVRSVAEGNMVWLHSKLPIHGKEYALADIFRVEGGKIVEHWDVVQEMAPSAVNPHPYF